MTTGYVFESCPEHSLDGHPEHPDRLQNLPDLLREVTAEPILGRFATKDEVTLIHTTRLWTSLQDQCALGDAIIDQAPTFVTAASMDSALRAAGGTLECVRAVLDGSLTNAFALVRPPGHHAEPDRAMGFCLFNNIAIGAAWALKGGMQRIAIVDFDAHHGNGTQAAFLDEPRVAYLSTHQWGIYPGTGWFEEGPGARGRIVNVPLPAGSGDATFAQIEEEIIDPFVRAFQPLLLLVSAGFDGHWNDPLTSLGLSSAGFHRLARRLVDLADEHCSGRIVFVLEGGYDPTNLANGARAVFASLMHTSFDDPRDAPPHGEPHNALHLAAIRALHSLGTH